MKKGFFITLLICLFAVSALFAMGKSETTSETTPATQSYVTIEGTTSYLRRGITYKFDEENGISGPISVTLYNDGTFLYIDYADDEASTTREYYLVGNDIYVDCSFARYYLENTSLRDGYTKVGYISKDEKSIFLKVYRSYEIELKRV